MARLPLNPSLESPSRFNIVTQTLQFIPCPTRADPFTLSLQLFQEDSEFLLGQIVFFASGIHARDGLYGAKTRDVIVACHAVSREGTIGTQDCGDEDRLFDLGDCGCVSVFGRGDEGEEVFGVAEWEIHGWKENQYNNRREVELYSTDSWEEQMCSKIVLDCEGQ